MCVVLCLCLCLIWHFHDGLINVDCPVLSSQAALIMNWQRYWQLSRAFHPLTAVYSEPRIAESVSSVNPRVSEKAMTAFVVSDSNG